ncbi:MAG TPA: SemiSWEET family transporter [Methanocella sp.]|nr:SemiSWEET family transporter [Methanocella sp.]
MVGYSEIGIIGSILLASAFLPQCYRMLSTKSAKDISIYYMLVLVSGSLCLTIYGFGIGDLIVFSLNLFATLCNTMLMMLKLYYDWKGRSVISSKEDLPGVS